jgi:ATP-dependent Clp protease ATP-binding subunit ClpA
MQPINQPDTPAGEAAPMQLDEAAAQCLDAARTFARFNGFPVVHAAHIALALLSDEQNLLDPLLKTAFNGLRAATICESLLEILKAEAESTPQAELTDEPTLSDAATSVLQRAGELAVEWQLPQVMPQAIAVAVFERPEPFLLDAFSDAGVRAAALPIFVERLAETIVLPPPDAETPPVFLEDRLNVQAFGPVAQSALGQLTRIGAAQPERKLRDVELLHCLVNQGDSLLVEALHLQGGDLRSIRGQLELMVGNQAALKPAAELEEAQMSRLLAGVFKRAQALAESEHCTLVSESHLIRAHLERVAASTSNLYEKLGVNTLGLKQYLIRHKVDRPKLEPKKPAGLIEDIGGYLRARVINQEQAVSAVIPALEAVRVGFNKPGQLMGVFLFLGPTGVGKTELARAIADIAFEPKPGVRDAYLIRLDCGRLREPRDIVQLLGAAQGLVGYKEGRLTNGLRDKPRAVILLDEAEKADPGIWQSLLTFFDEGVVHEADGTEHDATGCILVATSNLGYSCFSRKCCTFTPTQCRTLQSPPASLPEFIGSCVNNYFSPEFLGRFGRENLIFFNHFDEQSYHAIVRLQVQRLIAEMAERGIEVEVTAPAIFDYLTAQALQRSEEGARPVRRLVEQHLRHRIISSRGLMPNRTRFVFTFLEGSREIVLEDEQ